MRQKIQPSISERKQNALAKIAVAKERVNSMFSALQQPRLHSISSSDDEPTDPDSRSGSSLSNKFKLAASKGQALIDQLETKCLLIKSLQQQLKSHKCK